MCIGSRAENYALKAWGPMSVHPIKTACTQTRSRHYEVGVCKLYVGDLKGKSPAHRRKILGHLRHKILKLCNTDTLVNDSLHFKKMLGLGFQCCFFKNCFKCATSHMNLLCKSIRSVGQIIMFTCSATVSNR